MGRLLSFGTEPFVFQFALKNIKAFRSVILSFVLYGCETWSLALREEHRLVVFENMVLRKIFGPKRDEVRGHWKILHKDGLHALYSSPNVIRGIKSISVIWAGHVALWGQERCIQGFGWGT